MSMKEKLERMQVTSDGGVWIDGQGNQIFANHGQPGLMIGCESMYDPDLYGQALNDSIEKEITAIRQMNGTMYSVLISWSSVERTEGEYDFSGLDFAVACARENGISLSINLFSLNVSAGSAYWTPHWLVSRSSKYSRMKILGLDDETLVYDGNAYEIQEGNSWSRSYVTMCFNDPDTQECEKRFVRAAAEKIREVNTDGIINSVCYAAEPGYSRSWATNDMQADYRCHCQDCNAKFRESGFESETRYAFMQRSGYNYYREGAKILREVLPDMALFGTYAGIDWSGGDRYLERPQYFYPAIGVKNYFVAPSIMSTHNIREYTAEMNRTAGKTPGYEVLQDNVPFAVGIDPGHVGPNSVWDNSTHLELAQWYNLFGYGGMGGMYCGHNVYSYLDPTTYVYNNSAIFWAPLKAAQFYLTRFRSDRSVCNWWCYDEEQKSFSLGGFGVRMDRMNSDSLGEYVNYGFAMLVDKKELAIAATRQKSSFRDRITVQLPSDSSEWKVETGCYDASGVWKSAETLQDGDYEAFGNEIVFLVSNRDAKDFEKSIYRITKK